MSRVVDSFLLRDGLVIRPDLHRSRLSGHLGAAVVDDAFRRLAAAAPDRGEFFPRISGTIASLGGVEDDRGGVQHCEFELRPAPSLRADTSLYIPAATDPRRWPLVKGPDLEILGKWRAHARQFGSDDAVLHDGNTIAEAANSALIFFAGGKIIAPTTDRVLPSTTVQASVEAGLIDQPERRDITLREARQLPAWSVSALHGWTPVTEWVTADGQRFLAPQASSTKRINTQLWRLAEPVYG